jgi:hypothetical protein
MDLRRQNEGKEYKIGGKERIGKQTKKEGRRKEIRKDGQGLNLDILRSHPLAKNPGWTEVGQVPMIYG